MVRRTLFCDDEISWDIFMASVHVAMLSQSDEVDDEQSSLLAESLAGESTLQIQLMSCT